MDAFSFDGQFTVPGDIINASFTATVAGTVGVALTGDEGVFASLLLTRSFDSNLGGSPLFSTSSALEVAVSFNTTQTDRSIAAPAGELGQTLHDLLNVPRSSLRVRLHGDQGLGELSVEGDFLFSAELGDTRQLIVAAQGDVRFGLMGGLLGSAAATVSVVGSVGLDDDGNDAGVFGLFAFERCASSVLPLGANGFNSQASVFTAGFNFTGAPRDIELPSTIELACNSAVPGNTDQFLDLPGQSVRVAIGGEQILNGFGLSGFFQIQAGTTGLVVQANGQLHLGLIGDIAANGFLIVTRDDEFAGELSVELSELQLPLVQITGELAFQVNTTGLEQSFTDLNDRPHVIPAGNYVRLRLDGGPDTHTRRPAGRRP
jgi:hypothetical protein